MKIPEDTGFRAERSKPKVVVCLGFPVATRTPVCGDSGVNQA